MLLGGEVCFGDDGEEGVTELGWVEDIPEEGVVRVCADGVGDGVDAGVDDVGEAVVGGVGDDGLEETKDVGAPDSDSLKQLFEHQQAVERLIG